MGSRVAVCASDLAARRASRDGACATHDGLELYYRHWPVMAGARRGVIVLFHGSREHSARVAHVVDELNLAGHEFFAWDARGCGRSKAPPDADLSFAASIGDMQAFMGHLQAAHAVQPEEVFVVGQGAAAVLLAAWVLDHAPTLRGMTLAAAAFDIASRIPLAWQAVALLQAAWRPFFIRWRGKGERFTHDPRRAASYDSDRLIMLGMASSTLLGLREAGRRVTAAAGSITVPTQLLIGGADRMVRAAPQHAFFEALGSMVKERHEFPGFFHDVLGERDRYQAMVALRAFIERAFETPAASPTLQHEGPLGKRAVR